MKYKKGLIVICLIICLFMIASVSAVDGNATSDDIVSPDESNGANSDDAIASDKSDDSDIMGLSNENDVLNDFHSFTELQTLIDNADETGITLNDSYSRGDGENTITIKKSITINGNDNTINAYNQGRIFSIENDAITVVLKNIKFYNGQSAENGGAILNTRPSSYLTLYDCYFYENNANNHGGAIYSAGDLTISRSKFMQSTISGSNGSAIYCEGKLNISDSEFRECEAESKFQEDHIRGGTVFSKGKCYIDSCRFYSNKAICGAAILAVDDMIITGHNGGNMFTQNSASFGAIYGLKDIYIDWDNDSHSACTFQYNSQESGGAIYCEGNLYAKGLMMSHNTAGGQTGAAVYCKGETHIKNSEFTENLYSASPSGLEILVLISRGSAINSEGNCYVESCQFDGNFALTGGAIYAKKDLYITGTGNVFKNNQLDREGSSIGIFAIGSKKAGGAIYCKGNLFVNNTEFIDNNATLKGGAIYCEKELRIYNSKFENNAITGYIAKKSVGGAIWTNKLITANNCSFYNNNANPSRWTSFYSDAGAIYVEDKCDPEIILCKFEKNDCEATGGAIYMDSKEAYLKISDSLFFSNEGGINGGAIYCEGKTSVSRSLFENNKVKRNFIHGSSGGAIYSKRMVTVDGCYFSDNHAHDLGGAIYADDDIKIKNSEFDGNSAKEGGAIYTSIIYEPSSNSKFIKNKATDGDGGAIYINNKCNPKLSSFRFEQNTCTGSGGAIYLDSSNTILTLSDSTFNDNQAGQYGGAIFAPHGGITNSIIELKNCHFTSNSAKEGGAIYASNVRQISNSEFLRNKATSGDGGAIYINNKCEPKLASCRFEQNTCTGSGGAIYMDSAEVKLKVSDSTFADNHADKYGGGIYAGKYAFALLTELFAEITELKNCRFEQNTAKEGGAIYVSKIINSVSKSVFLKNKATSGDGGAIYINNKGAAEFVSCRFEQNAANDKGGAIYLDSTDLSTKLKASYCTFVDNHAEKKISTNSHYLPGHSIYNKGKYSSIDRCWLGRNDADAKNQFIEFKIGKKDVNQDLTNTLKISMTINETDIYKNNTYRVTVHFSPNLGNDLLHSTGIFYGDGQFYNVKADRNDMTVDVIFNADSPVIHGKLDYQNVTLNPQAKDKDSSEVHIISCEDIKYPNVLNVTYEIIHMADGASYVIKNTQGEIVRQANLTGPNNLLVENLTPGKYPITINNPESRFNLASSNTTTFTVNRGDITLMVVVMNETYPDDVECVVHASVDGEYTLTVAGCSTEVIVKNHVAHFHRGTLDADTYEAIVSFEGNSLYSPISNRTTFTVSREGTNFEIEVMPEAIPYGERATVIHTITPGAGGKIKYYLHNGTYLGESSPGEDFTLPVLNVGTYVIIANYTGDHDHLSAQDSTHLTVNKAKPTFNVEIMPVIYGSNGTVTHILPDGATGTIKYYFINGTIIGELPVENNFTIPVLNAGTYLIIANYSGDGNFLNATANTTLTVNKAKTEITAEPVITEYKDNDYLMIVLKDCNGNAIAGVNVTVDLNGAGNYTTDENGQINISTSNLAADTYTATFIFNETGNYWNCSNATQVFVSTRPSVMTTTPVVTIYQVHKYLVVNLKDNAGNPISNMETFITINGVTYKCRTDGKGDARLIIRLDPKDYIATAVFDNGNYTFSLEQVKVTVYKATPKIIAKNKKFRAKKKVKKYKITLKDNKGKAIKNVKVTLKVKGKTYKVKTNAKGQAIFKIKKLTKKGTFKATITYKGNYLFKKVSKKVKITCTK